jgi:general secretion pathway protein C
MNAASWLEGIPVSDKWRTLLSTHGPRAVTWALAVAVGMQAAVILVNLLSGPSETGQPGNRPPTMAFRHPVMNVAVITNAHLFGAPPPPAAPSAQDAATAPRSTIPLVLTGVVAADDPRNGVAVIGPSAQVTKVYAVGDMVPGGATLHSVYVDRVVINRGGHLESLPLPKQLAPGTMPNSPPPSASVLPLDNPALDRMRRLVADQPGLIADIMRPQPVYQDNKLNGYRVFPGRDHQAFTRLGLHPGDLVTAINGTPLDDPARAEEIMHTLDSASDAHVTVVRNGQSQDLVLNMAQVAQEAEALAGPAGAATPPPAGAPGQPPARFLPAPGGVQ